MDRFDDLLRRKSFARYVGFVARPHIGDSGTMLWVRDITVARQLVTLVAVLASALAVALAGNGRHAAAGFAELAGREPKVDGGEHVVHTFGVLLDASGVQHHPGRRRTP